MAGKGRKGREFKNGREEKGKEGALRWQGREGKGENGSEPFSIRTDRGRIFRVRIDMLKNRCSDV